MKLRNQLSGRMPLAALVAALFAAVSLLSTAPSVSAQSPMKMKGSAGTSRGIKRPASRGANPNIKHDEKKANPASARSAAKSKRGGARGTGNLHFDNGTNLYVRCYVDGSYVGTMGPGGDLYDYESGVHTMYCLANFDDGSTTSWPPEVVDAPYHLTITP